MKEYHKIETVFKRDEKTHQIVEGSYSLPEFEFLKNNTWVLTEKVDGTNVRVIRDGASIVFAGKTDSSELPIFLLSKLQELFDGTERRQIFRETFGGMDGQVCLYGEGYGAKIQKGGSNYKSDGVDFVLFDVKIGDLWLERLGIENIALKFGVQTVPIIGEGTLSDMVERVRGGFNSHWGDFPAEGIVARPKVELKTRSGDRIITKLKHKDFNKDKER